MNSSKTSPKKTKNSLPKMGTLQAITVGDLEKKYGVKLDVRSDMKLSTWFKKEGYPSLARLQQIVDNTDMYLAEHK